jgi:hypothetical protein
MPATVLASRVASRVDRPDGAAHSLQGTDVSAYRLRVEDIVGEHLAVAAESAY